ncbi:MAG: SDR family oxidoreductase [Gemmatimonadota bacterium]|nr:SDR family oxidoreductase [Gemmatimonadota bacterium]
MDLGLRGRNCIVTGGSRGIGRAIALGLAAEGANVAICARNEGPLRETEAELRANGVTAYAESCDVADAAALAAFLDAARKALGGVDVFVHNASALAIGPDLASWDASLQVDLMAAVRACELVLPWMEAGGGGSILFVSSISGLEASPMSDYGYTAAKAALLAYAKKLSVLYASRRIRVNAVAPGSIEFPGGIWAMVKERQPELYGVVRASIPSGRLGTPEEVADVAVYLVSSRADWVTGECVAVDGGQHRGMR